MKPITIIVATLLLVFSIGIEGRVYTRCQLARTLYRDYKFPKDSLGDWVCLIEAESGRNSRRVSKANKNGSKDYGLFQINSQYWCSGGAKSIHNICAVPCSALTNDNIGDDVNCAKKIYGRQGYKAWYGWKKMCAGKNVKSYIEGCRL